MPHIRGSITYATRDAYLAELQRDADRWEWHRIERNALFRWTAAPHAIAPTTRAETTEAADPQ